MLALIIQEYQKIHKQKQSRPLFLLIVSALLFGCSTHRINQQTYQSKNIIYYEELRFDSSLTETEQEAYLANKILNQVFNMPPQNQNEAWFFSGLNDITIWDRVDYDTLGFFKDTSLNSTNNLSVIKNTKYIYEYLEGLNSDEIVFIDDKTYNKVGFSRVYVFHIFNKADRLIKSILKIPVRTLYLIRKKIMLK